ncbi:hypothetical protein ACP3TH_04500, partial [Desulforudis sp. 1031]|uniref:hypothetical protein n=1 Tax=unclassified Candidatus Desulforudis TaxID=2635950 RepID=UPI003CF91FDD
MQFFLNSRGNSPDPDTQYKHALPASLNLEFTTVNPFLKPPTTLKNGPCYSGLGLSPQATLLKASGTVLSEGEVSVAADEDVRG